MYHSKKIYLHVLVLVFSIFSFSFRTNGQNVQVTMDVPPSVSVDDRFQLTIVVNAQPSDFTPPVLSDFNVLSGPNVSNSRSISIINNKMSENWEYDYTYILQPKKAGKIEIQSAEVVVGGKKYFSNKATINVTDRGYTQTFDENSDLFLKVFFDKKNVYQGEFITATVKLYTRLNVRSISPVVLPSFEGFYKQEMEFAPPRQLQKEVVNGKAYQSGVVGKFILIPQKAGELTVAPCSMICEIASRSGDGFFDDFFPSPMEIVKKEAVSNPIKIHVNPLPNRPASFTGAVGKFNMEANYDKTRVNANDPVILRVNINGAGNIKLIDAPKINFPDGIETSDPTTTNKTNDKEGDISGTKQFEYLLIPRAPGKMVLPPIEFSYFDPIAKQFKTLTSSSVTLDVNPGSGNPTVSTGTAVSKENLKFLGKDIEYIKLNDIKLKRSGSILFGSIWFYAGYLIPLLLFASILLWRRNYIRQNANTALNRNRKAQKYAIKRLQKAKEYLAQSKKENFYEEVLKALWGYLSDKLNIPVSDLSRDYAREQLIQTGVDNDLINRLMNLLDTCEFARYAPASTENTMETDYKEAIAIITQIQERKR